MTAGYASTGRIRPVPFSFNLGRGYGGINGRYAGKFPNGECSSHKTPCGSYIKRTVPPKSRARKSLITRLPNPNGVGLTTVGPPASRQLKLKLDAAPLRTDLEISTFPAGGESAPYFVAFVASSLMASVSDTSASAPAQGRRR
jgi:hypothetical protein